MLKIVIMGSDIFLFMCQHRNFLNKSEHEVNLLTHISRVKRIAPALLQLVLCVCDLHT